jgi:hypothetical protein
MFHMKLSVKAQKIEHNRFKELLKIMRLWPDYQRNLVAELLRHIQHQVETIENLEATIRDYKQLSFIESKPKFQPTLISQSLSAIKEPKQYTTKGQRYYSMIKSNAHLEYAQLTGTPIKEIFDTANQYAKENNIPELKEDYHAEIL